MTNLDMAYALVQMLGQESVANNFDPETDRIMVEFQGETVELADQDSIPAELRGHVQAALTFSLMNVSFEIENRLFQEPKVIATFNPDDVVTRAHYAVLAGRMFEQYYQ
jgi:serine protease AprX